MSYTPVAATAGAGNQEAGTYAMVEAGSLRLAVNARHVVQAIPRPSQLTVLPRGTRGLAGVFSHRGQVVPLVSLDRWLNAGEGSTGAGSQVLVLRDGDKVLGLAVDAVRGLLRLAPNDIHRVHHDDDPEEFFDSVALTGDGAKPVSLLDPARLAARAQAWAAMAADSLVDAAGAAPTASVSGVDSQSCNEVFAVMRIEKTLVGFAAQCVGEVLPMPRVQKMVGTSAGFLGMMVWRERDVPIIDLGDVAGVSSASSLLSPLLVVLCDANRCVAVPLHETLAIRSFSPQAIQAAVAVPHKHAALHAGTTVMPNGERVILLNASALIESCPLSALSQRRDRESGDKVELKQGKVADADGAYVVFRARQLLAAPLRQMEEIVRYPDDLCATHDAGDGVLGTFEWRGQAIPLLDPGWPGQREPMVPGADARAIVVRFGGTVAAIMVSDVVALIPANSGVHSRFTLNNEVKVHMITLGRGEAQTSYRVTNFSELSYFISRSGSQTDRSSGEPR